MFRTFLLTCSVLLPGRGMAQAPMTVEIAPGVRMPRVNQGTCCGSEVILGLPAWLAAGGRGIDTAYDYGGVVPGGKQSDIRAVLAGSAIARQDLFISTKIPAGYGVGSGFCLGGAAKALEQVQKDVAELGTTPDMVLLHAPCLQPQDTIELWRGLEQALAQNLTRAIGVSNYNAKELSALLAVATVKPAVNQCLMSLGTGVPDALNATIASGVTFEAFEALHGCPFGNKDVQAIAAGHGVGVSNVCLRWVLQHGAIVAVGLGSNASTVPGFARSNLDVYGFELTGGEMRFLDAL